MRPTPSCSGDWPAGSSLALKQGTLAHTGALTISSQVTCAASDSLLAPAPSCWVSLLVLSPPPEASLMPSQSASSSSSMSPDSAGSGASHAPAADRQQHCCNRDAAFGAESGYVSKEPSCEGCVLSIGRSVRGPVHGLLILHCTGSPPFRRCICRRASHCEHAARWAAVTLILQLQCVRCQLPAP